MVPVPHFANNQVKAVFRHYPGAVRPQLLALRELIFETATGLGVESDLEETLKWGEPGYLCPTGSTIRPGWEEKDPGVYKLYFHCQTRLVPTFRELYHGTLDFEGNRAIRLPLNAPLDKEPLSHCIRLALHYHKVKNLPNLGTGS